MIFTESYKNKMKKVQFDISAHFDFPAEGEWEEAALKLLKGRPFRETLFTVTDEQITLKPIYGSEDRKNLHFAGYKQQGCRVAQSLYAANDRFNAIAQKALANGQTALKIDLDPVSAYGRQIPFVPERFGALHLTEAKAFETLFTGIDLENVPLLFDARLRAAAIADDWLNYARTNNTDVAKLKGGLGAGPLCAGLHFGGLPHPPAECVGDLAPLFADDSGFSKVDVLCIYCDDLHNAGAPIDVQLAYFLNTLVFYIHTLSNSGVAPQRVLESLRLRLAIGPRLFSEIAKLRAARMLWDNICRAYLLDSREIPLKIDAVTSYRHQSYFDPWVNMLRGSGSAFAALVGGCDSLDVLPFDLPLGAPDDFSRRQARNTQIILKEESHLLHVTDPAAGSGYLDTLSLELAEKSWKRFRQIEAEGGIIPQIESGRLQDEIQARAETEENEYIFAKRRAVGSNVYPNPSEKRPEKPAAIVKPDFFTSPAKWPLKPLRISRVLAAFEQKRMEEENEKAS